MQGNTYVPYCSDGYGLDDCGSGSYSPCNPCSPDNVSCGDLLCPVIREGQTRLRTIAIVYRAIIASQIV